MEDIYGGVISLLIICFNYSNRNCIMNLYRLPRIYQGLYENLLAFIPFV